MPFFVSTITFSTSAFRFGFNVSAYASHGSHSFSQLAAGIMIENFFSKGKELRLGMNVNGVGSKARTMAADRAASYS